jgi:hypothetical protein
MKHHLVAILAGLLGVLILFGPLRQAAGQGTAFTYQGQLQSEGAPANGSFDLTFSLFDVSMNGTAVAGPITNSAVAVNNGLFTLPLDFGAGVFNGTTYWLQIGVRTNGGGSFSILSPRQELTPTPYAIYAEGASASGLSGTIPAANLSGTYSSAVTFTNSANRFTGDGSGLTGVKAATLGGLSSSNFWQLGGNAGVATGNNVIGTTDNQYLDVRVNNVRAMRFRLANDVTGVYSNAPNVIGGSSVNLAGSGVVGATIAGGGGNDTSGKAYPNWVAAAFGTVGGGSSNYVGGLGGTVAGGEQNTTAYIYSTVGGGQGNNALNSYATVAGGGGNTASGYEATVGGGVGNTATANYATVPGGFDNTASGYSSFAAGQHAQASDYASFVWSDGSQNPFKGANFNNGFNVLASGGVFFFNGGEGVHLDYLNQNTGTIDYGLRFGAGGSGEGIASQRAAGGNQYGLDFYTSAANRMSIANNGFVGINTTSPSERLEVNGQYVRIDGAKADNGSGSIAAYIGGDGSGSDVQIGSMNKGITAVGFWNHAAGAWMHIACSSITINGGADLAEPFPISKAEAKDVPQGSVLVIDEENPGQLRMSDQPYDTRVAGVVSGANGLNPGIQMQQQDLVEGGKNVALSGRVYALADASNGTIRPGDLLTTSSTPGHAMKVTDHAKASGAILGKAMTGLSEGTGMVLVLVTLQ